MNRLNMSAWPVILVLAGFVPVIGRTGEEVAPGWEWSYKAGLTDGSGAFMGGSTIVHLVGHGGSLYAGNSYWQDSTNIWYGGKDAAAGWAQVLRLDKPGGQWAVDLALGPQHLRVESLSLDPSTRETVHLVGFEAWVVGNRFPVWGGRGEGGFYKGAMYAIRDRSGNYRLKEVNGKSADAKPPLVAPYAFALSPFKGHEGETLYFGGHDANDRPSHNRAWIFCVSLKGAL